MGGFLHSAATLTHHVNNHNRAVMGEQVNGAYINILGWLTTAAIFFQYRTDRNLVHLTMNENVRLLLVCAA
jgi:xanthine dehydrogenase molybdopterin-binding subunit B